MKFIYLRIPIIDTGHTPEQKREKIKEEIDELLAEFCIGDVNKPAALEESFDVVQVITGYLLAEAMEILSCEGAHDYLKTQIKHANERHLEKMMVYAAERGWKVAEA